MKLRSLLVIATMLFGNALLASNFGPIKAEAIENVPSIDLGGNTGRTGYIDFLNAKDFPQGHSVVKFVDAASRPGIAVKYNLEYVSGEEPGHIVMEGSNLVTAFFQRYSGLDSLWVGGGHKGTDALVGDYRNLLSNESLNQLLMTGETEIKYGKAVYKMTLVKDKLSE